MTNEQNEAVVGDAFGAMLLDYLEGRAAGGLLLEVDDGQVAPAMVAGDFFLPPEAWPEIERAALRAVRGRVLDLGCGAGRHALHFQAAGHNVVAIDASPGAVEVARRRGVKEVWLADLTALPEDLCGFDTVLMLCGNMGLGGEPARTRALLVDLWRRTVPGAVLIGDTVDPTSWTSSPRQPETSSKYSADHPPGLVRIRLRYGNLVTPWFLLYNIARDALDGVLAGTGWRLLASYGEGDDYSVVLERLD